MIKSKEIMGICRACRISFDNGADIYMHEISTGHRVRPARTIRGKQK